MKKHNNLKGNMKALYDSSMFTTLTRQNIETLESDLKTLEDFKLSILNGDIPIYGLCNGVICNLIISVSFLPWGEIFYYFPNFSGTKLYPIEGSRIAYSESGNLYNLNKRNGRQRIKLLNFIIKVYKRAIKANQVNNK